MLSYARSGAWSNVSGESVRTGRRAAHALLKNRLADYENHVADYYPPRRIRRRAQSRQVRPREYNGAGGNARRWRSWRRLITNSA